MSMNKNIAPVLDKISAILKEHDMAGVFCVADREGVDYRMDLEPSWMASRLIYETEADGRRAVVGVHVRCKRENFSSKEEQKKVLEQTVGTFVTMTDVFRKLDENFMGLLGMIGSKIEFQGKSTNRNAQ